MVITNNIINHIDIHIIEKVLKHLQLSFQVVTARPSRPPTPEKYLQNSFYDWCQIDLLMESFIDIQWVSSFTVKTINYGREQASFLFTVLGMQSHTFEIPHWSSG